MISNFSARFLTALLFAASTLIATQAAAVPSAPSGMTCLSGLGLTCYATKDDGIAGPGGNDTEMSVEDALAASLGGSYDVMDIGGGFTTITGGGGGSGTWIYIGSEVPAYLTVKSANSYNLIDVRGMTSGSWTTPTGQGLSHANLWKEVAPVPEPSAALLFGVGVTVVGSVTRRRF
jgi:hypothetical protein